MTAMQLIATVVFAVAVAHTFATKYFERLAHRRPNHAGMWHLLGEIEVVFGFWAMVLMAIMAAVAGTDAATAYLDTRNFTEPMFVFAIMVVSGTRAVLEFAKACLDAVAAWLPDAGSVGFYLVVLTLTPLLGSFITEPAAMTLAALTLRDRVFSAPVSGRLKYATLGVLFVNVSIGGTLTSFAAPPVLMVASTWGWSTAHMMTMFGWKAAVAVMVNAAAATLVFRRELAALPGGGVAVAERVPAWAIAVHLALIAGIVGFAHHIPVFMGLFLLFMGFATAYPRYQDRLILREGLLVAFFLAGLVVLGGQQQWWLEPLLRSMGDTAAFYGSIVLTAVTDNAALTYLASLVDPLSDAFKYSIVAGAVAGGGLTVIANAPNPAGIAILRDQFPDGAIHPLGLLVAAMPPTAVAVAAFRWL